MDPSVKALHVQYWASRLRAMPNDITRTNYDERLSPKQAADRIGVSLGTLWNWRKRKVGPPFLTLVNRIVYRRSDIDAWEERNRVECGD
jgi:predicted DNA-binding transcriptional regulator AlpA